MDKGTVGGIILALVMLFGALAVMASHRHGDVHLGAFIDIPALMLICGGSFSVAMIGFPLRQSLGAFKLLARCIFHKPQHPQEIVEQITSLAEIARREGLLALEAKARQLTDPTVAVAVHLVVDGTKPEVVRELLQKDIEMMQQRHRECKKMIELVGRCGPAFGMVATLLGLILMLGNLQDPDSIGPSMAVALVGTMYGALTANLIAIPFSEKLNVLDAEEVMCKEMILAGVMSIQDGESPRVVRQKLEMFLPPTERRREARAA